MKNIIRRKTARAITTKKPLPIPMTQQGFDKARLDYTNLQTKREEVLLRLQAAREMGDLSENGAYTSAKFELSTTDRELRRLGLLVKYGQVTSSKQNGKVDFGSVVTIEGNGKQITFTLVSGFESNPSEKKLSIESPFGKAVFGHSVNDEILVVAPAGEVKYRIIKVE